MEIKYSNLDRHVLYLAGSAASLSITRKISRSDIHWLVEWEVIQSGIERTKGATCIDTDQLRVAFNILPAPVDEADAWLIERFGGDRAHQGQYIGWKQYLNIPCPGTGQDGDPNISLEVTDEIKKIVTQIICAPN